MGKVGFGALRAKMAASPAQVNQEATVSTEAPKVSPVIAQHAQQKPATPMTTKNDDNGPEDPAERFLCDGCA